MEDSKREKVPQEFHVSQNKAGEVKHGSITAWIVCSRPKTWPISTVPVFVGLSLVLFDYGSISIPVTMATLLLAILMQAISNMENDAGYTKRKAENGNRKGLPRATSNGWLAVEDVELAIKILAVISIIDTAYLIYAGGWLIFIITAASVIAGYTYMGGPKPTAYTPFGELLVFIFFGLAAVCGTYYLQAGTASITAFLSACSLGLLASAVLAVNNYRDRGHDESVGRMTLAVVLGGKRFTKLYGLMLYVPYVVIGCIPAFEPLLWPTLFTVITLPMAVKLRSEITSKEGYELNDVMFGTVRLEIWFSALLAIGALLGAALRMFSS